MTAISMYGNPLIIFFPGTSGQISKKLGIQHQGLKPIIVCSNDNHGLTLTYFTARSNFAAKAFIWENVTVKDSLEIIEACDLKVG